MQVKPVRETILQALHCWRSIERKNVPEPSDMVSAIKGLDVKAVSCRIMDVPLNFWVNELT